MRVREPTSDAEELAAGSPRARAYTRIAERYDVIAELGHGGMACVLRALDTTTGRELALKRLLPQADAERARNSAALFEREYHTLAQLAHPRVVTVHDYGVDAAGPYYTMELLGGGDLRQLSPLPWREACERVFDVCSALSLLHSRRLVHRDISPRNIRCTPDGGAKLIDFGAMLPMGAHAPAVGTPAFVAPEVVLGVAVDARTDLFSLGATLYYALTGEHAFPARTFSDLHALWADKPAPPSDVVPDVPAELDRLVGSLISPDPALRPRSVYEVMQRLLTIAEIRRSVPAGESQAALVMPGLVGRDHALGVFRRALDAAGRHRGKALMITGSAGVGRSRMLDACALEAKLLGASVVRVMVAAEPPADFASARALAVSLVDALPELAPAAARDAGCHAQLFEGADGDRLRSFASAAQERPLLQAALERWFLTLSRRQRLVILVDDVQEVDEGSLGVLAALAEQSATHALVVLVAALERPAAGSGDGLEVLSSRCERLRLQPLDPDQTQALLGSVFGDVPNLALLAARLHALSAGCPRQTLVLARYLVDRGTIRYAAGSWSLPEQLSLEELPATEQAAIRSAVEQLGASARSLIYTQALSLRGLFTRDDCLRLEQDGVELALDELLAAGLVSTDGRLYGLVNRPAMRAIASELPPEEQLRCHGLLAGLYRDGERPLWESVRQLLLAGELTPAFERLIPALSQPTTLLEYPAIAGVSVREVGRILARMVEVASLAGRSAREQCELRRWVALTSVQADDSLYWDVAPALFKQLESDSGLAAWRALGHIDDAQERLMQALQQAAARHAALPEDQRGYAPADAIRLLVEYAAVSIALSTRCMDAPLLAAVPAWLEPFAPLSPLIASVWQNALASCETVIERTTERALERWRAVYDELADITSGDLEIIEQIRNAIAYGIGTSEASLGLHGALKWAEVLDRDALQRVSAMYLRKIVSLQQGDFGQAEAFRKQAELLALQSRSRQMFTSLLPLELSVHAAAWDLTGVKHIVERIEPLAARYPGWVSFRHLADGHHRRLSGDLEGALQAYAHSMALVDPSATESRTALMAWPLATTGYVEVLVACDRAAEARSCAARVLHDCQARGMQASCHDVERALALAEARLGEYAAATGRLDQLLARQRALGVTGLNLGATYEARARVAIWAADADALDQFGGWAAEQYRHGEGSPLGARYERLIEEAHRAGMRGPKAPTAFHTALLGRHTSETSDASWRARLNALHSVREPSLRAERALEILCEASDSSAGHLFVAQADGLRWASSHGALSPGSELQQRAQQLWVQQGCEAPSEPLWHDLMGITYQPVLLTLQDEQRRVCAGVALLSPPPDQPLTVDPQLLSELARLLIP